MKPENTSVTGVMVTGKTTDRYPLALASVEAFTKQVYAGDLRLLIINDNPVPLFPDKADLPPNVTERFIEPQGQSLGHLRNVGIELVDTDYIVQWDDDDYSHANRVAWQVTQTVRGMASIFKVEVHCNLLTGQAFVNNGQSQRSKGFPGTMLWPRAAKTKFPLIGKHEDTEFVLALRKELANVAVLQNNPHYYFRCYHGHNTWSQQHVMKRKPGSRDLGPGEQTYVDGLLNGTYKQIAEQLRAEVS